MKIISKEERDFALNNYKFSCRKDSRRYGNYFTKTYTFLVPAPFYEIFSEHMIRIKTDVCESDVSGVFSMQRDKKTKIINPVLALNISIQPNPGEKLDNDEDESTALFCDTLAYLEDQYQELVTRKFAHDSQVLENAFYSMSRKALKSPELDKLLVREKEASNAWRALTNEVDDCRKSLESIAIIQYCRDVKDKDYVVDADLKKHVCNFKPTKEVIKTVANRLLEIYTRKEEAKEADVEG